MKRRNLLTALVVVALAIGVPTGLAAKGGNGHGNGGNGGGQGGGGGSTATINVSPNPAPADGARVDITGCGYEVEPAEIRIVHSAGYTEAYMDAVWADGGCLNPTYFLTREAGTYTVNVYQTGGSKGHPTHVLKASTTLAVE
jgi:hypothetical protein